MNSKQLKKSIFFFVISVILLSFKITLSTSQISGSYLLYHSSEMNIVKDGETISDTELTLKFSFSHNSTDYILQTYIKIENDGDIIYEHSLDYLFNSYTFDIHHLNGSKIGKSYIFIHSDDFNQQEFLVTSDDNEEFYGNVENSQDFITADKKYQTYKVNFNPPPNYREHELYYEKETGIIISIHCQVFYLSHFEDFGISAAAGTPMILDSTDFNIPSEPIQSNRSFSDFLPYILLGVFIGLSSIFYFVLKRRRK